MQYLVGVSSLEGLVAVRAGEESGTVVDNLVVVQGRLGPEP
jgi:hypothetical protein